MPTQLDARADKHESVCMPKEPDKKSLAQSIFDWHGRRGNDLFLRPIISSKLISVLFNQTALNQYEVQRKYYIVPYKSKEAENLKLLRSGAS